MPVTSTLPSSTPTATASPRRWWTLIIVALAQLVVVLDGTIVNIALPQAQIAVMGPEAAINAVFFNQIQAIDNPEERQRFVEEKRREYAEDIDILHLASELVVDAVIEPDELRAELVRRFALAEGKDRRFSERRNPITPA